jgi:hypothetical protein
MKKPIITNGSIKQSYYLLVGVLIILIISYGYVLSKYRKHVVNFLTKKNSNYGITYSSVSSNGLFFINNKIKDLQLRTLKNNKEYILKLNTINIKNLIFTKVFTVSLDDKIEITDYDGETYILNVSKNNDIIFELSSSNKIKNFDAFIQELYFAYKGDSISIKNFMVNLLRISTYDDIINNTVKVSSDSIIFDFKENNGVSKTYETNFELLISSIGEIGNNGKITNQDIAIEKIVLNDITNNFAFNIEGDVKNNYSLNSANATIELKLINYNSILRTINSSSRYFLLSKEYLSMLIELLNTIPSNTKNTVSNKFYTIKYNTATKRFTLNDINGENIVKAMVFQNNKKGK